jgi:hypothetical protein
MSDKRCDHCVERLAKCIARGEGVVTAVATEQQQKHYLHLGGLVYDEVMEMMEEAHDK